ncbi:RNA polymerase sigma factor [Variovorax ureilyticus]|uniref:RNA polymerase sigma factor n=1 Tax=Variovorax ureilyticus TaxID=1836198 RepID=UPI003D666590
MGTHHLRARHVHARGRHLAHLGLQHRARAGHGGAPPERPGSGVLRARRGRRWHRGRAPLRPGRAARGPADAHPSAGELAFWRAAGRRLQACLDELSDDQRAAFLLHHEEGFTVEVVARTLGVDADTACDRLRHGLETLRDCMERYLAVLERHA